MLDKEKEGGWPGVEGGKRSGRGKTRKEEGGKRGGTGDGRELEKRDEKRGRAEREKEGEGEREGQTKTLHLVCYEKSLFIFTMLSNSHG